MTQESKEHNAKGGSEEGPVYSGGNGSTPDQAVVIENVDSHVAVVRAESEYLSEQCGLRGIEWDLTRQTLMEREDGTPIDEMVSERISGETETVYFDISNFFGMDLES